MNWFKDVFLYFHDNLEATDQLKVGKLQNEYMKSSFLPKYEPKIARISACDLVIFNF